MNSNRLWKIAALGGCWLSTLLICFIGGYALSASIQNQGVLPLPGQASCTYEGKTYRHGEGFPASDGCNTCGCSNGEVACTLIACDATPPATGAPAEPTQTPTAPTQTTAPQPTSSRVSSSEFGVSFLLQPGWRHTETFNPDAGEAGNGATVFEVKDAAGSQLFYVSVIDGGVLDHWCSGGNLTYEKFQVPGREMTIARCSIDGRFSEAHMSLGGQRSVVTKRNDPAVFESWKSIRFN